MKTKMQVGGAIALVVVVALGAWNVAFAENNPGRTLVSQLIGAGSPEAQLEMQMPLTVRTAQVTDDNTHPEDLTPEAEHMPEAISSAEPGDDNGGQGEAETHAEISGTVSAIDEATVTINGQVFNLAANAEGTSSVQVGDTVKLEFVTSPDGSVVVREVKLADASSNPDESNQSVDDSSIRHESGDDSGSDSGGHGGGGSDDGSGG